MSQLEIMPSKVLFRLDLEELRQWYVEAFADLVVCKYEVSAKTDVVQKRKLLVNVFVLPSENIRLEKK